MTIRCLMPTLVLTLQACGGGGSSEPTPTQTANSSPAQAASAAVSFTDRTLISGLQHRFGIESDTTLTDAEYFAGGIAAGDYDSDGDVDLYVASGNLEPAKLFRNMGNNVYVDVSETAGVQLQHRASGATFADIDGDGLLDLFVGAVEGDPIHLFRNIGEGQFTDVTASAGILMQAGNTISAAFGDYDLDGDLDMAVSHWGNPPATDTEHLWQNNGDLSFSSASVTSGIAESIIVFDNPAPVFDDLDYTFTPTFADLDNDRYPDLLMVGDFTTSQVFMNNRDGTFRHATTDVIKDENGMGSAVADIDNDGDLDWFVSSIYNREPNQGNVFKFGNRMYMNDGTGQFSDETVELGLDNGGWGWAACLADFNNDGLLDVFHTNGWRDGQDPANDYTIDQSRLFMALPDGRYDERATEAGITDTGQGRGVVCFDSDRDGDIDLVVTNNQDDAMLFYENTSNNGNGFMLVKLRGDGQNSEGVGARIYLTTASGTQMREITVGSNYTSQNPAEAHFGTGQDSQIQRLRVVWPNGEESILENIRASQFLEIQQS